MSPSTRRPINRGTPIIFTKGQYKGFLDYVGETRQSGSGNWLYYTMGGYWRSEDSFSIAYPCHDAFCLKRGRGRGDQYCTDPTHTDELFPTVTVSVKQSFDGKWHGLVLSDSPLFSAIRSPRYTDRENAVAWAMGFYQEWEPGKRRIVNTVTNTISVY